jgi:hypothetical protein
VLFVADPVRAPARSYLLYARPDDHADDGVSWRKRVAHYNATSDVNPFGLSRAYELFGIDNTMILSAGRGRRSVTMSCYPYHRRSWHRITWIRGRRPPEVLCHVRWIGG